MEHRTPNRSAVLLLSSALGLAALSVAVAACADDPPTAAVDHSAHLNPLLSAHASRAGGQILILDNCDPETFAPGACTNRSGGMSFSTFIAQLQKHQRVEGWRFAPGVIHVTRSMTLPVVNRGGVIHDFTEVAEFGGGYNAGLNQLSGNPIPAPECVVDPAATTLAPNPNVRVIAPGEQDNIAFEPGETKKYQCCLHPWMRAVSR